MIINVSEKDCGGLLKRSDSMKPYIFNIQKFSLHDGPGIRTTVFFKGCPLRCKWCHNPESQCFEPEFMLEKNENDEKKKENERNNLAGKAERKKQVGKEYSVRELVKLLKKDQIFYDQSGGGVTLSGGEVMVQDMDYVEEVLKSLNREGIFVVIDTSGQAETENFDRVLPYTDLFLYDLKNIRDDIHKEYTGVSNERILKNLKYLSERGAAIELRMIMVKDVNMDKETIEMTIEWLKKEKIKLTGITLLSYHDFGRDKYRKLNRECTQNFEAPTKEALEYVKNQLEEAGYPVKIHS